MKTLKNKTVEIIYAYASEDACPAPWAGTTNANCFCCEYYNGVFRKKFGIYVKCCHPIERKEVE